MRYVTCSSNCHSLGGDDCTTCTPASQIPSFNPHATSCATPQIHLSPSQTPSQTQSYALLAILTMSTTYYTYKDPFPATLNHPDAVQLESTEKWPKKFRYNSNYARTQGIHPPAPVYTANQSAPQSWYYYGGQVSPCSACQPITSNPH